MSVVIAALSGTNFLLFRTFIGKIDIQQGPKSHVMLMEEKIKNTTHSLIANSFNIARQLKFEKASRNAPIRVSEIKSLTEFAILDQGGSVVAGDAKLMSSQKGIPAVERALKEGYASDGTISIEKDMYLVGAVPVMADVPGEGKKLFGVVSIKKLSLVFKETDFSMPVRVFLGERFVTETMSQKWGEVEKSCGTEKVKENIAKLLQTQGQKELNPWTFVSSYFLPYDELGGEKVTFLMLVSTMPGFEDYSTVALSALLYAFLAIIITLFFTFIVTHTINQVFKTLAADVSNMKVGEKIVTKRYAHGADNVVSALNTLITKYLKHCENPGSAIDSADGSKFRRNASALDKGSGFENEVPSPFSADDIEDTPKKPFPALSQKSQGRDALQTAPLLSEDDDDDEKTQIMDVSSMEDIVSSIAPVPEEAVDPMEQLWLEFRRIKEKNGGKVSEREKKAFIGKIRTNRASIMAKYECSDVLFTVEEKDGKPIIKAKAI
ncbi:MAG: MXAN_5187 C-terminal domain-containing protein [bacterium]